MSRSILSFLLLVAVVACQPPAPAPEPAAEPAPEAAPVSTDPTGGALEAGGLTFVPRRSAPEFPGASLALVSPSGGLVDSGPIAFEFAVDGYALGEQTPDAEGSGLANSAKGQHIHLIVDNGPYSAHYEPTFETELGDGHHVVLAFLSRSYHESLKDPEAALVTQLTVGEVEAEPVDLAAPLLFYSRPKGTYTGADTEHLLLDFYVMNAEIGPDAYTVRATVGGEQVVFTEWVPYVVEGLGYGEIEITLELVGPDGVVVPGAYGTVSRTVTLEPAAEPTAG